MCGAPASAFTVLGRRLNRSHGPFPRTRAGVTTSVCRCRSCDLIFANPQPVPPSVGAHHDVSPEQYLNYANLGVAEDHFSRELDSFERLMPIRSGMRSLDVGAGVGQVMEVMARRGCDACGLIFAEAPFSRWLVSRLANWFYWLSGTDYVSNLSPMHAPFHFYEFTVSSFQLPCDPAGYVVEDPRHEVCDTYMPRILRSIASGYMAATDTGMQLCLWMRKGASPVST